MTIQGAFEHFTNTATFAQVSKQKDSAGAKLRSYVHRYNKGELGDKAIEVLLIQYGYDIKKTITPPKGI